MGNGKCRMRNMKGTMRIAVGGEDGGGHGAVQAGESGGGRMRYAEVSVSAEFGGGRSVQVSPDAFAWLEEVYGPGSGEWPVCEAYRAAALSGALYALGQIPGYEWLPEARVTVERIHASAADTSPDDVEHAAAFAVWEALGVGGLEVPELGGEVADMQGD